MTNSQTPERRPAFSAEGTGVRLAPPTCEGGTRTRTSLIAALIWSVSVHQANASPIFFVVLRFGFHQLLREMSGSFGAECSPASSSRCLFRLLWSWWWTAGMIRAVSQKNTWLFYNWKKYEYLLILLRASVRNNQLFLRERLLRMCLLLSIYTHFKISPECDTWFRPQRWILIGQEPREPGEPPGVPVSSPRPGRPSAWPSCVYLSIVISRCEI